MAFFQYSSDYGIQYIVEIGYFRSADSAYKRRLDQGWLRRARVLLVRYLKDHGQKPRPLQCGVVGR